MIFLFQLSSYGAAIGFTQWFVEGEIPGGERGGMGLEWGGNGEGMGMDWGGIA